MRKIFNKMKLLIPALLLFASMSTTSLAYNFEDYEFTDDGFILVDDKGMDKESSAVLYLYTDVSDRNIVNVNNQYTFDCTGGAVVEGRIITPLMFKFNPFNAKTYATLDDGEVWVWEFALKNGEYRFSTAAGSVSYGSLPRIMTLNNAFEYPRNPEGYGVTTFEEFYETVTLENEQIRLYAMYGNEEWRAENEAAFIAWAKETEESFRETEESVKTAQADSQETIKIEQESAEANSNTEEVTEEAVEETEEVVLEEIESEPEDTTLENIKTLLSGAAAIAVLAVCGFILGKKKNDE